MAEQSSSTMRSHIILASNSPRRRELLAQIGWAFSVDPADVNEQMLANEKPEHYAVRVAMDKAHVAARRAGQGLVIAADTIVVLDNEVLGKPRDARDAMRMLTLLSGRKHRVITGVVVMDAANGRSESRAVSTRVWFRALQAQEVEAYVATGEPMDKAGAYGIQERGALLVERIDGCYFNVVGLPLAVLAEMLELFGVEPFDP